MSEEMKRLRAEILYYQQQQKALTMRGGDPSAYDKLIAPRKARMAELLRAESPNAATTATATKASVAAAAALARPAIVPTTPEEKEFVARTMNSIMERLCYLYSRWLDEREYEDFAEYAKVMSTMLPAEMTFGKASKRPFGFTFSMNDKTWQVSLTARNMSWRRTA